MDDDVTHEACHSTGAVSGNIADICEQLHIAKIFSKSKAAQQSLSAHASLGLDLRHLHHHESTKSVPSRAESRNCLSTIWQGAEASNAQFQQGTDVSETSAGMSEVKQAKYRADILRSRLTACWLVQSERLLRHARIQRIIHEQETFSRYRKLTSLVENLTREQLRSEWTLPIEYVTAVAVDDLIYKTLCQSRSARYTLSKLMCSPASTRLKELYSTILENPGVKESLTTAWGTESAVTWRSLLLGTILGDKLACVQIS
jgi:hypothetical protein